MTIIFCVTAWAMTGALTTRLIPEYLDRIRAIAEEIDDEELRNQAASASWFFDEYSILVHWAMLIYWPVMLWPIIYVARHK